MTRLTHLGLVLAARLAFAQMGAPFRDGPGADLRAKVAFVWPP
jgi:hypothetical protein